MQFAHFNSAQCKSIFTVLYCFLIVSCGGGGGGDTTAPPPPPVLNNPPTVSIDVTEAVNEGEYITVQASASDSDGSISSYSWQVADETILKIVEQSDNTVKLLAQGVVSNTNVTVSVTVADNDGATAQSSTEVQIVNQLYSQSPHRINFLNDQDLTTFWQLFNHDNLNTFEITITEAEWQSFMVELSDNIESDKYFKSSIKMLGEYGELNLDEVGIRIRGNLSRKVPEVDGEFNPVHFKLKFNETFDLDPDTLEYLDRQERRLANLRAINLKTRSSGWDESQIRELYAYDLFNQVGVSAPLTGSARLIFKIGERTVDYGIYTMIEPIDKTFLRKRFGDDENEGNLYKCLWESGGPATLSPRLASIDPVKWIGVSDTLGFNPSYDLKTNKSNPNFSDLETFISELDKLSGDSLKSYLDSNFAVDNFLKYLALNVLIGMPDDYWAMGNNYYLYFAATNEATNQPLQNDYLTFFPYDYDSGFGGGWQPFATEDVDIFNWYSLSGTLYGNPYFDQHPLADKILAITEYRNRYTTYLSQFIDSETGLFTFERYSEKFNDLKQLYDPDNDGRIDSDIRLNVKNMLNEQQMYFEIKLESVQRQLSSKK